VSRSNEAVSVPLRYPTAAIFVDESGSKSTAGGQFFVVAAVKVRQPGRLARAIREVRDRTSYGSELKFSSITRGSLTVYYELIAALEASDTSLAACVVQGDVYNPFRQRRAVWKVHAEVTSQLLVGCLNRRELVGVHLDGISTPAGCSLEDEVRRMTNRRLRATAVVTAVCLDSKTNDLLQVADLVAGAIFHERRRAATGETSPRSNKGKVALRLATAFNRPGLIDGRDARVNIATYLGRGTTRAPLKVVNRSASAS
jgi:Protein of unknown function (DUF3800)